MIIQNVRIAPSYLLKELKGNKMFRRKNVFFVNKQDVKLMIMITIMSSLGTHHLFTVGRHGNDDKTNIQGIVLIKYKHRF